MDADLGADKISSLPKNVIDTILMCLPMRDVVRTSMLSRGWRYEWSTLPQLVIDRQSFPISKDLLQPEFDRKMVKIVDIILLLHHGPIHKFKLSIDLESNADIDRWILFLSRNGIKEFTLDKWKGQDYKLPSCLFSCVDITYLELFRCIFIPPTPFKGFSRLTAMDLQHVTFTDNGLPTLLSLCPLLKILVLKNLTDCTRLKISAQELVKLTIKGTFDDINIESTPLLATLCLSIKLLAVADNSVSASREVCGIVKVLGHLPSIHHLEILDHTLQNLAGGGNVPIYITGTCPLKDLVIHINFEDMQEMLAAFCILRSSPVMEKLDIRAISDKNIAGASSEGFWGAEEGFECSFSHLQVVDVTDFTGITSELKLIELILANAPVLERLRIKFKEDVADVVKIFRELIRYPRNSPKAQLFVPA